jgi:histidine ammonia-lyase
MSPIAARKLSAVVDNLERVLAIELIAAFQAMEFLKPLKTSPRLERVRREFRRVVRPWTSDRELYRDLDRARDFVAGETLSKDLASLS